MRYYWIVALLLCSVSAFSIDSQYLNVDTSPPVVSITSESVSSTSLVLAGTAHDDLVVSSVRWENGSLSGSCSGLASWSAAIPLSIGENLVSVTASDSVGNVGVSSRRVVFSTLEPSLNIVMSTDKLTPKPGELITTTQTITNVSTVLALAVSLQINIPSQLLLVGSITINGVITPLANGSVIVPDIPAGGKVTIIYQYRVR